MLLLVYAIPLTLAIPLRRNDMNVVDLCDSDDTDEDEDPRIAQLRTCTTALLDSAQLSVLLRRCGDRVDVAANALLEGPHHYGPLIGLPSTSAEKSRKRSRGMPPLPTSIGWHIELRQGHLTVYSPATQLVLECAWQRAADG